MQYKANTRIGFQNKTFEPGQVIDDLPEDKAALLLKSGSIERMADEDEPQEPVKAKKQGKK